MLPPQNSKKSVDEESPLLLHHRLIEQVSNSNSTSSTVTGAKSATTTNTITTKGRESEAFANEEARTISTISDTWKAYNNLLDKNPLLVKGVTAFFVLGLGDMCGQGVEHLCGTATVQGLDWIRAGRFGMFGLVGAPWAHYYFYYLDYYFPPTEDPFTLTTAIKLLIDQGLQAPALLALIIVSLAILKGGGWVGVANDLQANYWNALIANWKLWIPASLINLAFVKPSLRVLYVNVVFFVWTIILSVMLNAPEA